MLWDSDIFGRKTMLRGVGSEGSSVLKPGETVNSQRYRQQMIDFNHVLVENPPEWEEDASTHSVKVVNKWFGAKK